MDAAGILTIRLDATFECQFEAVCTRPATSKGKAKHYVPGAPRSKDRR